MSKGKVVAAAPKPNERLEAARARYQARPRRPTYPARPSPEDDPTGEIYKARMHESTALMADAMGSRSGDFLAQAVHDLTVAMQSQQSDDPDGFGLNAGLAAVAAVGAQNEIEAQLAVQMAGTHRLAMQALGRASRASDFKAVDSYGTLATKMLRTYTTQLEALAKLRRGGQQTVRVEHVHVYEGGQAIVGHVETGGGRGQIKNGHQPHAPSIGIEKPAVAAAVSGSVLCDHSERQGVPFASREREEAVPHARRSRRKRGASGIGERELPSRP